jgi:hypothetical protein
MLWKETCGGDNLSNKKMIEALALSSLLVVKRKFFFTLQI